jgi:transcriptional repressor NrdR
MNCPKCNHPDTKVLETRTGKNNTSIRRRRQCLECDYRFTTIEEVYREDLYVVKRDGTREEFDRMKMITGIHKAIEKRPIEAEQIRIMILDIMDRLEKEYDSEVPTRVIGEMIMERLKSIDQIAYVRFASIYKDFRDIAEFAQEIKSLKETT